MNPVIAWTIAGSDASGCAGIQADLKTFQSLQVHGCSVITAVTAQNIKELRTIAYVNNVNSQIATLQNALPAKAIKMGMLGNDDLTPFLKHYQGKVVLDPVMISTSGNKLFSTYIDDYLFVLKQLFPYVDLITPNIKEAELLLGRSLTTPEAIEDAAQQLLTLGMKSVLIKGGHALDHDFSQDYWTNGKEAFWLACERRVSANYRGSGCTLSAAITACLAQGFDIKDALVIAKMYVSQCLRLASGSPILIHAGFPEDEADLPYLSQRSLRTLPKVFAECGQEPLGLYPIVDSAEWLKTLLPLGVKTIQLRIKDKQGKALENEIKQSVALANQYQTRLFVNDYWELAIRHQAYGVHLGQEDLAKADINKIHLAGLRLGISTHCYYEVARAHAYRPSYIACGPIYKTTSKQMAFAPQGLDKLHCWRRTLKYPLVAIGGINLDRLPDILAAKVDGVALISAITQAINPEKATKAFLNACHPEHSEGSLSLSHA